MNHRNLTQNWPLATSNLTHSQIIIALKHNPFDLIPVSTDRRTPRVNPRSSIVYFLKLFCIELVNQVWLTLSLNLTVLDFVCSCCKTGLWQKSFRWDRWSSIVIFVFYCYFCFVRNSCGDGFVIEPTRIAIGCRYV